MRKLLTISLAIVTPAEIKMLLRFIRSLIIVLSGIFAIANCGAAQAQPISNDSHILIISAIGNTANISHAGSFLNTNSDYPLNGFDVNASVASIAKQTLNNQGYSHVTIIHLPQGNLIASMGVNIFHIGLVNVDLKPELKQYISQLIANKNVDYVMLFTPANSCPIDGNCDMDVVPRFGVVNAAFLTRKTYYYTALNVDVLDARTLKILDTQTQDNLSYPMPYMSMDGLTNWLTMSYQNTTPMVLSKVKMFNPYE